MLNIGLKLSSRRILKYNLRLSSGSEIISNETIKSTKTAVSSPDASKNSDPVVLKKYNELQNQLEEVKDTGPTILEHRYEGKKPELTYDDPKILAIQAKNKKIRESELYKLKPETLKSGTEKYLDQLDLDREKMLKEYKEDPDNPMLQPLSKIVEDPWGKRQKFNIFQRDYENLIHKELMKPDIGVHKLQTGTFVYHTEYQKFANERMYFFLSIGIFFISFAVWSVPLYKVFCGSLGSGHSLQEPSWSGSEPNNAMGQLTNDLDKLDVNYGRQIKIRFVAGKSITMDWNFRPEQSEVTVYPGETALVFYKAKNPTDKHVIGVSSYHINPVEAAGYFNKIQCFCFEQQMLGPHEEIELPVFFYIDPEIDNDPKTQDAHEILLSYTFFQVKDDFVVPLPGYKSFEMPGEEVEEGQTQVL